MNLLLDTHIFIWLTSDSKRLSDKSKSLIADLDNVKYLSLVSLWEIQIKHQLGKLELTGDIKTMVDTQRDRNGIELLPITIDQIVNLKNIPLHHRDPFDRLLISQAMVNDFVLISHDSAFEDYDVQVIW